MSCDAIHVLGASGSGTTTLGRELSRCYGYTHLDTDDFCWLPTDPPFQKLRNQSEQDVFLKKAIKEVKRCAVTGSLYGWSDEFKRMFDLVVFVTTPAELRAERLRQREYERFGDRIMPGGDMYDEHTRFVEWAKGYDHAGLDANGRNKAKHERWLTFVSCPIVRVDGSREISEITKILEPYIL